MARDQIDMTPIETRDELVAWLERNPDRARRLSIEDRNELLALQGATGPLKTFGVEGFVQRLERQRRIVERIHAIAATEYLDLLEQIVNLIHDKVQPGFGSAASGNSTAWKKPDAAQ